ncbi:MAG TPA: GNAT family N-acetyltransferase [Chitinophagaceae bacterium]|nr:GNAT family N-acetyltransferase [Chitinophagaceae bacterium]
MVEDTIPGSGLFNGISAERLQQMMAHNHTELFKMNATANGGEVRERSGVVWTNEGGKNKGHIPFPVMTRESAGAIIDEILQYYREREITNIGCWSLHPLPYRAMGVQLLARGFQPGWRPNWMALDLDEINTGYAVPPGLEIIPDNETSTHGLKDLPYSGDNGAVAPAAMKEHAGGIVQRFFAMLDGKIAGQSAVFIPPGGDGACGLYEVGVLPALRNRGIGKAVVTAACVYAKQQGCRYATLNGTG